MYRRIVHAGVNVQFVLIPLVAFDAIPKKSPEYERLNDLTAAMEAVTDGVTHDLQFPGPATSPQLQSEYGTLSFH